MKRQGGFTLIELVVVIVILGILAVTAAPRFLNLQDDARNATIDGLRGAIAGATGITYGKAAIAGVEGVRWTAAAPNEIEGVQHSFGYPTASDANGIGQAFDQSGDFVVINTGGTIGTNGTITYGIANYTGSCVVYSEATNADTPATVVVSEDTATCTAP